MIDAAIKKGATRIHLADHAIATEAPDILSALLKRLECEHPRTRLYVLGEVSAREIIAWPEGPIGTSFKFLQKGVLASLASRRSYLGLPISGRAFLSSLIAIAGEQIICVRCRRTYVSLALNLSLVRLMRWTSPISTG